MQRTIECLERSNRRARYPNVVRHSQRYDFYKHPPLQIASSSVCRMSGDEEEEGRWRCSLLLTLKGRKAPLLKFGVTARLSLDDSTDDRFRIVLRLLYSQHVGRCHTARKYQRRAVHGASFMGKLFPYIFLDSPAPWHVMSHE